MTMSITMTPQDTAEGTAAALLASSIAIYYAIGGKTPVDRSKIDMAIVIVTATLGPGNPLRAAVTTLINNYADEMPVIT